MLAQDIRGRAPRSSRGRSLVSLWIASLLAGLLSLSCQGGGRAGGPDGFEPPANPYLARSPWPIAHRNSYQQDSSPYPALRPEDVPGVSILRTSLLSVPVILTFTSTGIVWGMGVSLSPTVVKIDPSDMTLLDDHVFLFEEGEGIDLTNLMSGAYSLMDVDDRFWAAYRKKLRVFADSAQGDPSSAIAKVGEVEIPDEALCRPEKDSIVGINMTYDGQVVFATSYGIVGVVQRDLGRYGNGQTLVSLSLNDRDRCDDAGVPDADLEHVSNSIAVDETGGIYVVTDRGMHRVQWDPAAETIEPVWREGYEVGAQSGLELGGGARATPTLMGREFVVFTDGADQMNLVVMWRNEIPSGWSSPNPDYPRMACEVPTFDDPSLSEQSVLVRGHAMVVVNNVSGATAGGIERYDWEGQACPRIWSNRDVNTPNGIPTMSAETDLIYVISQYGSSWYLEAIAFGDGHEDAEGRPVEPGGSVFRVPSGEGPLHNSVYSATTIGPGRAVLTGVLGGVDAFLPAGAGAGGS